MSSRSRVSLLCSVALAATCLSLCVCKPKSETESPGKTSASRPQLPKPYPLPKAPPAAFYLAQPAAALQALDPYLPATQAPNLVLRRELNRTTTPELAKAMAQAINPNQPWAGVELANESVGTFFVAPNQVANLHAKLTKLPKEGKFGAVRISESWLAWLDVDRKTLIVANSLRGISTGLQLRAAYGQKPVFVSIDPRKASAFDPQAVASLPFGRVIASGNLEHIKLRSNLAADKPNPFDQHKLGRGTLAGLLLDDSIAVGVSARPGIAKERVRKEMAKFRKEIDRQNFLVQGVLNDMYNKLSATVKSWNGRSLAAVSGKGHIRIAYGSNNAQQSAKKLMSFISTSVGNAQALRSFSNQVPPIAMKKNAASANGTSIHWVQISRAAAHLPKAYRAVLNDKGQLNLAIAHSQNGGGVMIVAGKNAVNQMKHWVSAVAKSPNADSTKEQNVAVRVATSSKQWEPIAQSLVDSGGQLSAAHIQKLLSLTADTKPVDLVLKRGNGNEVRAAIRSTAVSLR